MENTHNVIRVPVSETPFLVSGFSSTTTSFPEPVTARYSNCFPISESQWATEPKRRVHKREGWVATAMSGGDPLGAGTLGACTVQAYTLPLIYTAKGNSIYRTNYSISVVTEVATVTNAYTGWGTNAINDSNVRRIAWLAGDDLVTFDESGASVTTTDLSAINLDGSRGLVFINGYLFAVNNTGIRIYNSNPGGVLTTWNATNFLDAEQYADETLWIDKHHNYLVAFGQASVEFFFDAGIEVGSPLKRQESYSTRIGLFNNTSGAHTGDFVCNVEDDLYFLGLSEQQQVGLFRVKNFKIEALDNQYLQGLLNDPKVGPIKIVTCSFNNNPQVVVFMQNSPAWVYFVKENTWWRLSGSDYPSSQIFMGKPFNSLNNNFSSVNPDLPRNFIPIVPSTSTTTQHLAHADLSFATSVTSQYRTDVIDMGINRWKHLARIDAIGDFSTNTLTLTCNPTPNYGQASFTATPIQAANTIGYGNNISWYNLGAFRRFNFQIEMTGTNLGIFEAFDVEYNIGVA